MLPPFFANEALHVTPANTDSRSRAGLSDGRRNEAEAFPPRCVSRQRSPNCLAITAQKALLRGTRNAQTAALCGLASEATKRHVSWTSSVCSRGRPGRAPAVRDRETGLR